MFRAGWTSDNDQSIVVARSEDGGASWSPGVEVARGPMLHGPALTVESGGALTASWNIRDQGMAMATSADGGDTWSAPLLLFPPGRVARGSDGSMYAGWVEEGDVRVARSTDGGANWSEPVVASDVERGSRNQLALAVDAAGAVHVAWSDTRTGDVHVAYAKSEDGGATWSANVRVTTAPSHAGSSLTRLGGLTLAVDAFGAAHILWTDERNGDRDIYSATVP